MRPLVNKPFTMAEYENDRDRGGGEMSDVTKEQLFNEIASLNKKIKELQENRDEWRQKAHDIYRSVIEKNLVGFTDTRYELPWEDEK